MNLKQLATDVGLLAKVAPPKHTTIPVIKAIMSRGQYLFATNLEQTLLVKSPEITIPRAVDAQRFAKTLAKVTARKLSGRMEMEKNAVAFSFDNGKTASVPYLDIDSADFPKMPARFTRSTRIKVTERSLRYVARHVSTEVVRYALTGVLFDGDEKHIAASDGKRLAFRPMKSEKKFKRLIIPGGTVKLLLAILKANKGEVKIERIGIDKNDQNVSFDLGRYTVFSRVVEGTFPNWQQVIPNGFRWTISLDAESLWRAAKSAVDFFKMSERKEDALHFVMKKDCVQLVAKTKDQGNEKYDVKAHNIKGETEGFHGLILNPGFVLDALWNRKTTFIQGNTRKEAAVFDGTCVVMPLTIESIVEKKKSDSEIEAVKATHKLVEPEPDIPVQEKRDPTLEDVDRAVKADARRRNKARQARPKPEPRRKPEPKPAPKPKRKSVPKATAPRPKRKPAKPARKPAGRERTRDLQTPLFNW